MDSFGMIRAVSHEGLHPGIISVPFEGPESTKRILHTVLSLARTISGP